MTQLHIPVIVHRWFARGEGWAFHPDLQPYLVKIIQAVESRMTLRSNERFSCRFGEGHLVCDLYSDACCPNRLAVGRNPSILRVAYCKRKLSSCEMEEIYELLDGLDLPHVEGSDEQLEFRWRDDSMFVLAEMEAASKPTHEKYPEFIGLQWASCPVWGVLGALLCVLVSVVYSLQAAWDIVRWSTDLSLVCCLAWVFYWISRDSSGCQPGKR